MKKIDAIDRKIIQMLQSNARTTIKEIAAAVYLSSPSVAARINRMEEEGLIVGYHAQVNPMLLNYNIKAFVNLDMQPSLKEEFYPYIRAIPNVVECNCVTGDFSMLIKVLFETTDELDEFINGLQRFGKTMTQIVFSTSVHQREVLIRNDEDLRPEIKEGA